MTQRRWIRSSDISSSILRCNHLPPCHNIVQGSGSEPGSVIARTYRQDEQSKKEEDSNYQSNTGPCTIFIVKPLVIQGKAGLLEFLTNSIVFVHCTTKNLLIRQYFLKNYLKW